MSDFELIVNAVERDHIVNLLKNDRRLDGRKKNEMRDVKIEIGVAGKANGSSLVHLGKTKVMCGVKSTIMTPWSDYPNQGSISVGFETSPMAAPEYRVGPPQPDAIEIARVTDRVIRESQVIDLDDLLMIPGEKAWNLNIDLYVLDDFGNLFDAAALAAFAALTNTTIPEVKVEDEEIEVLETMRPIKLKEFPVSVTTYKVGDHFIIDGELREEQIAEARITFGLTEEHIVSSQKGGAGSFKSQEIMDILREAIRISADIRKIVAPQLPNLDIIQ